MASYLEKLIAEIRSLNIKDANPNEPCSEDPSPEGDVILSIITDIRKGEYNPVILFHNAMSTITAMCMMKSDLDGFEQYTYLYDNPSRVHKLVELAIEEETRSRRESLIKENSYINKSANSLELFNSNNHINIYKQNFIQVMAYFDSCIFSMVRTCMEHDFFKWLAYFENVNIKTHELAACDDFESFKVKQIEASLKKCYVKDLLNILHDKFNGVFNVNGIDMYSKLQEMIGRRNVHIHNNGIVDEKYLEKFNIYGATLGQYLTITKDYFNSIIEITRQVVMSIANTCI